MTFRIEPRLLIVTLALVIGALGGCDGGSGRGAAQNNISQSTSIGTDIRIEAIAVGGTLTQMGLVTVPYLEVLATAQFANVAVDLDGDGVVGSYLAGGLIQEEWILQNVPFAVAVTSYSSFFDLVDAAVANGGPIRVKVVLSDVPLPAAPSFGADGANSLELDVTVSITDTVELTTAPVGSYGNGAAPPPHERWVNETAGDDLDLGSVYYRPGVPDVPQSPNSCVLHSFANSLSWMARVYNFEEKLTDQDAGVNVTTTEGVNELAFQINDVGALGWTPQDGVKKDKILSGKDAFTQAKSLPVVSKMVDTDIFEEVKKALQQGKDVELAMDFPGTGGHVVTVVGFSDIMLPSGERSRTLTFHDGAQGSYNDLYSLEEDSGKMKVKKFPLLGQLRDGELAFAIVECFEPPPSGNAAVDILDLILNGSPDASTLILPATLVLTFGRITIHSSISIAAKAADTDPRTHMLQIGVTGEFVPDAKLRDAFGNTDFPLGQGPNGFTICADPSAPQLEGQYFFAFCVLEGPLWYNFSCKPLK